MTQNRVFKLADIRNLNKQVSLGQISSMRMVEILNAMAYEWHSYKLQAYIDKQREIKILEDEKQDFIDKYISKKLKNNKMPYGIEYLNWYEGLENKAEKLFKVYNKKQSKNKQD